MEEIKLNSNGTNTAIKAHILSDEEMRTLGFTDYDKRHWYFCRGVGKNITFNVTIPKDGSDIEIITLDESFCQPYDYQYFLSKNKTFLPALMVQKEVEKCMDYLQEKGVLSGHTYGEYI